MDTIGYIYFENGDRMEAAHMVGGNSNTDAECARKSVEASTRQRFEFELRNHRMGPKPTRYDVQQFR